MEEIKQQNKEIEQKRTTFEKVSSYNSDALLNLKNGLIEKIEILKREKEELQVKVDERNEEFRDYDSDISEVKDQIRELRCLKSEQERLLAENRRDNQMSLVRIEEMRTDLDTRKEGFQGQFREHKMKVQEDVELEERKIREMHER